MESGWQTTISEFVVSLRNRAEHSIAAELAEMLYDLSNRFDRAS